MWNRIFVFHALNVQNPINSFFILVRNTYILFKNTTNKCLKQPQQPPPRNPGHSNQEYPPTLR